ncbi:hypothetical protein F5050DRAFT_1806392 [Lentinula boryana]|uniref:G protein-coupled receptor n=1 Tax=Lentinula boryana TaxID=40481 RepID=A0ABQ8QHH0_9AGAR|nr:hypothetical protein F5050DRAFT_1806392 [Lentinula boryana]
MTASQLPSSDLVYDTTSVYTKIFIGLQLAGLIGNIVTLIIAYFSPVTRQATWYNCIFMWCLYSIAFLLLFFSGHYHDPSPPFDLCLIQSALIHAASPSATAATLALVVQRVFSSQFASYTLPNFLVENRIDFICHLCVLHVPNSSMQILAFPYVTGSILVALFLVLSLIDPSTTTFNITAYCAVNQIIPYGHYSIASRSFYLTSFAMLRGRITAGLTIALVIPMMIIDGGNRIDLRPIEEALVRVQSFATRTLYLYDHPGLVVQHLRIRGFVNAPSAGFGFFLVVFAQSPTEPIDQVLPRLLLAYNILNIFLSIFPVAVMLIFGTHEDIIRRLFFCERHKMNSISEHAVPSMSLTISSPPLEDSIELESRIRTVDDNRFNESQSSEELSTFSKRGNPDDRSEMQGAMHKPASPWEPP